jgi:hypothetical protein
MGEKDIRSFGGKRQIARPEVDWKIMLKRILKKYVWAGFIWLWTVTSATSSRM